MSVCDGAAERVDPVVARGGIQVAGEVSGFGEVGLATSDFVAAISGREIVMVAVPATEHRAVAAVCAPHLVDGQTVILNPGRTLGALEFYQVLRSEGCDADVVVAEAQSMLYSARMTGPGQVRILQIRNVAPIASRRAHLTPHVLARMRPVFPQFVADDSILATGLNNIGPALHPTQMVLNAGWVEDSEDFEPYWQGASVSVSLVLDAVDRERVAVAEALGIRATTFRQWLYVPGNVTGRDLHEVIRANSGYKGAMAPGRLTHRHLLEDVPTCLVPIASLGREYGQATPTIESIINLAGALLGRDFRSEGRTVERLGIAGLSVRELRLLTIGSGAFAECFAARPGDA